MEKLKAEFKKSIIPGNYWITKSMEFTKENTSGTLWYLKKWITYYYYVFLTDLLEIDEGYKQIEKIFDNYIGSMPNSRIKREATKFFYTEKVNIKNANIKKWYEFVPGNKKFENIKEKEKYIISAKKYYFFYLMEIGGQSGINKEIKKHLYKPNTTYENIVNFIKGKVSKQDDFNQKLNDYHASLRNERQIFFYYGFFHGREMNDLRGFYKLTEVGYAILQATYDELIVIWEHQKLKMISQSPVTIINGIKKGAKDSPLNFNITKNPYLLLLTYFKRVKKLTLNEYMFFISRINDKFNINDLITIKQSDSNFIKELESIIKSSYRKADYKSEDFSKELKKYVLGITDMKFDFGGNPFTFLQKKGRSYDFTVKDMHKLDLILKYYQGIANYKEKQMGFQFRRFEKALQEYYESMLLGKKYSMNKRLIREWNVYKIFFDKPTLSLLIVLAILLKFKKSNVEHLSREIINQSFALFKNLLSLININTKKDLFNVIKKVKVFEDSPDEYFDIAVEKEEEFEEHYQKLLENVNITVLSQYSQHYRDLCFRKRSTALINAMRSYYIENFSDKNKLVRCDCCKRTTFLTESKLPYLEFHHIIPFSKYNGPDHYLNLVGICPDCHRKLHFAGLELKEDLYTKINQNNHLSKSLIERLKLLKDKDILEPIHLEFLNTENAITDDDFEKFMNDVI
jgi:HNH endonuclease